LVHRPSQHILIRIDPEFFRPAEVDVLLGDPTACYDSIAYRPVISFKDMVERMVKNDYEKTL